MLERIYSPACPIQYCVHRPTPTKESIQSLFCGSPFDNTEAACKAHKTGLFLGNTTVPCICRYPSGLIVKQSVKDLPPNALTCQTLR